MTELSNHAITLQIMNLLQQAEELAAQALGLTEGHPANMPLRSAKVFIQNAREAADEASIKLAD